jgi:hypothetical protein
MVHQIEFLGLNLEGGSVNSFEECLAAVREDFKRQMRETFGVELSTKSSIPCILI